MAKYEDDEEDVVDDDEDESTRIISVLAETNRRDRWAVSARTSMLTVLARSYFDFRKVEADGDVVELNIICVCGHITLVVPEGTKVQLSGFSFLASANSDVLDAPETPSPLPKLKVNATTVFGRISIRTPNAQDLAPALAAAELAAATSATAATTPASDGDVVEATGTWQELPEPEDAAAPADDDPAADAPSTALAAESTPATGPTPAAEPAERTAETVGAA